MNVKTKVLVILTGGAIGLEKSEPYGTIEPLTLSKLLNYLPENSQFKLSVEFGESRPFGSGIDSCNMNPSHWMKIAQEIEREYDEYDGFIVLHGTDTLSYTGAALSFILENLSKPIVITGSQRPLFEPRTDAINNLYAAIQVAAYKVSGLPRIPEVVICFHDKILRGNRARHVSDTSWDAFDSPNFPPLGTIGKTVRINRDLLQPIPAKNRPFRVNSKLSNKIINISLLPGLSPEILQRLVDMDDVSGILLAIYGAGRLPYSNEYLELLKHASKKGKVIVGVSPVQMGNIEMEYIGNNLSNIGVISGLDMTPEAAFAKLAVTLGLGLDTHRTRQLLQYNWRGEQTPAVGTVDYLYISPRITESSISVIEHVNSELIKYLKNNPKRVFNLSPRGFELLVAEIFKHNGYDVVMTPQTRDGGFDFSALYVDALGNPFLTYVETKKYKQGNRVGIDVVRNLYGVVASKDISRGIIVTTSSFTRDAMEFQKSIEHRVSLRGYSDLVNWLKSIY